MESGINLGCSQSLQCFSDVLYMLFKCSGEDQDIIQVYQHKCIQLLSEYLIHEMLECCRCICDPERHYYKFEMASLRPKRCFVYIFFFYGYLMITIGQIDDGKMLGLPQSV